MTRLNIAFNSGENVLSSISSHWREIRSFWRNSFASDSKVTIFFFIQRVFCWLIRKRFRTLSNWLFLRWTSLFNVRGVSLLVWGGGVDAREVGDCWESDGICMDGSNEELVACTVDGSIKFSSGWSEVGGIRTVLRRGTVLFGFKWSGNFLNLVGIAPGFSFVRSPLRSTNFSGIWSEHIFVDFEGLLPSRRRLRSQIARWLSFFGILRNID